MAQRSTAPVRNSRKRPAITDRQKRELLRLGYTGDMSLLRRWQARREIYRLRNAQHVPLPGEQATSDAGQTLIYISRRIRAHYASGHRETIEVIECLHGDAERERNAMLRDYLDTAEPSLVRLINTICASLETEGVPSR